MRFRQSLVGCGGNHLTLLTGMASGGFALLYFANNLNYFHAVHRYAVMFLVLYKQVEDSNLTSGRRS
jgi:hypothetical protein